ncbi:M24 family metallopeptidase [Lacihabitans sp. LS3-19]|uniref:aminopeptidase P N-terminal domain-containing protein n=2 Tax=Lacihabitans sp. LS3-19 TaxID=2487335 RepID=UPI0020CE359E|nr:aminopeptidase P N-terminal domain-containing protein [Lacihabitans sp. LS3-19]MCP9769251.1 M24 family metallopeptidase [Lacihabitans sp. LS3-19]MCP9769264.1 M24 family metallopeptidase [Lacihabitans sp. LS3-19]
MRYENIPNSFYIEKRKKYIEQILPNSISIFASNDPLPSNADGTFGFIQNSTFFYLTGIDQEDSFLILDNRTSPQTEILFVKETNEKIKIWEGEKLTKSQATELSGIETIIWSEEFWKVVEGYLNNCENVYFSIDTDQGKGSSFTSKNRQVSNQIKRKFPDKNYINSAKTTNNMRVIKSDEEITQIKKAIEITKFGFERAAKNLKPEMYEFELEAEISYEFQRRRSRMHAFQPIMASGKNACALHYITNNDICKSGEIVLMDFGAEYGNYKADMTRVLPINGKFTDRQAEVYTSVFDVMKAIKNQMVVGNTIANLKKETQNLIGKELVKLKILTESDVKFNPKAIVKYFPHGVSHFLGIDVHDVGDRKKKLEAGMLLTLEPGIYIEQEAIGIRLENDILIKEVGNEDLMEGIPLEISEIEKLMHQ